MIYLFIIRKERFCWSSKKKI